MRAEEPSSETSAARAAVRAWTTLGGTSVAGEFVETLKERRSRQAGVYRLSGAGPDGSSIVAKRCALRDAEHERTVYERILPRLPLTTVRYYGFVADPANSVGWVFLEDAGTTRYSPNVPAHRELAARWLGILHTHGPEATAGSALPDRGLAWYRTRVQAALALLDGALTGGAASGTHASTLENLARWCQRTDQRWEKFVTRCGDMPSTIVHADFVGENVRVRSEKGDLTLLPFDWGTAGWGVPARDLVGIDLERYGATVLERWPGMNARSLRRAASVGRRFRQIAAVHRACMSLPYATVDKVLSDLRFLLVRA